jgi:hypothetical protein
MNGCVAVQATGMDVVMRTSGEMRKNQVRGPAEYDVAVRRQLMFVPRLAMTRSSLKVTYHIVRSY